MKVCVNGGRGFEPVELNIVIETEDELKELFHRVDMGDSKVAEGAYADHIDTPHKWSGGDNELLDTIIQLCKCKGIYK